MGRAKGTSVRVGTLMSMRKETPPKSHDSRACDWAVSESLTVTVCILAGGEELFTRDGLYVKITPTSTVGFSFYLNKGGDTGVFNERCINSQNHLK